MDCDRLVVNFVHVICADRDGMRLPQRVTAPLTEGLPCDYTVEFVNAAGKRGQLAVAVNSVPVWVVNTLHPERRRKGDTSAYCWAVWEANPSHRDRLPRP